MGGYGYETVVREKRKREVKREREAAVRMGGLRLKIMDDGMLVDQYGREFEQVTGKKGKKWRLKYKGLRA